MKYPFIALTLLLMTALALTACGTATFMAPAATATSGVPVTGPNATSVAGTPGATQTEAVATTQATPQATGAATSAATASATMTGVTPAATTVPTVAATATETATSQAVVPGVSETQTPFAGIPGSYVRLSILLQSTITTSLVNGQVTGVVIAQPQPSNGGANATPTADQSVPYVRYVVAHLSGTSGSNSPSSETLIPWQVFAFNPNNSSQSQTFTLKGPASALANAPEVSLPVNTTTLVPGWDSQVSQYWASQGFSVPVTGNSQDQTGPQIVLRKSIDGTNIIDSKNQVFGKMTDLLVDAATGQFAYAVFDGGQAFGNRMFVVPVKNLIFFLGNASVSNGLGNVELNFPSDVLNSAPFFNSLNIIPLNGTDLNNLLNNFWQNVQNNNGSK